MLQTLASIDAVGTYDYSNQKRKRATFTYKVFIVGTHYDRLEGDRQAVEAKVNKINQTLVDSVESASYHYHIKYSVPAKNQMIFTVNNFSLEESDFEHI